MTFAAHRIAALVAAVTLALVAGSAPDADAKKKARKTQTYKVVAGDTLGKIGKEFGCSVETLRRANRLKDADHIRSGQKLTIPGKCDSSTALEGKAEVTDHLVTEDQTLSEIAKKYGTTVAAIKKRNKLKSDVIRKCQTLEVLPAVPMPIRSRVQYVITGGDTLDGIARMFRTNMKEIQCLNKKAAKDPRSLRIGDTLTVLRYGPRTRSKTVGKPQAGKLVDGEQLPRGNGYFRRRPHRAWGTNETIKELLEAILAVKKKHKKVHDVAVGDISSKHGGKLAGHKSHQSGRDVDLGLYFAKQPKKGPRAFISAKKHKIDIEANWPLIEHLVDKARVEYIFLDYGVQKKLYEWAKKKKRASKKKLERMFQYPRGKRAMRGVIRHEPGHADHYHIRFKCPAKDDNCA